MVAVIENATQIFARFRQPDDLPQRHAFPQAHAERATQIQARHNFWKSYSMRFTQLQQPFEIERRTIGFGQWFANLCRIIGIRDHFELPRFASQPHCGFLIIR